ncbi:hypothetical protein CEXT_47441 [Caerostris extrusa]|uniref:Uncharacterized protein n=1 Tax=Caerostris extrusa TaxID=172846 RepID=A0AAV4VKU0_CAEEX|nr:hypothetical protein CEXT_47441 [Caerostris extrusa]
MRNGMNSRGHVLGNKPLKAIIKSGPWCRADAPEPPSMGDAPRTLGTRFYDHNFREPSPIQFDVRRPIKTTAPTISFSWTASKTLV